MMAANIGLRQLLMFATYGKDRICYARDQMRPVVSRLVERAQASGDLRPDFDASDVKLIAYMLASAAEYAATSRARGLATLPGHAHRRAPARPRHRDRTARPAADLGRSRGGDGRARPAARAPALILAGSRAALAQPPPPAVAPPLHVQLHGCP